MELQKMKQAIQKGAKCDDLTKQALNNSIDNYNRTCGPRGHPRMSKL